MTLFGDLKYAMADAKRMVEGKVELECFRLLKI
jgi:hypothetical protein